MRMNADLAVDMATLARLHAALDSVVETEHVLAAIHATAAAPPAGIVRVSSLLGEAREVLRALLARPERRVDTGT